MSYLLDTNVLSELRRGDRANPGVLAWWREHQSGQLWLSVLVVGELRRGVELLRRRDATAADSLDDWLVGLVDGFADRILPVDDRVAERWGRLGVPDPVPVVDGLLAATALVHDLALVTRNVADVAPTGVRFENPFSGS